MSASKWEEASGNFSNNKKCSPVHLLVSELLQNILENCTGRSIKSVSHPLQCFEAEQIQPESGTGRRHGRPLHLDVGPVGPGCLGPLPPTCVSWEARGQGNPTGRQVSRDPDDPQQQDPPCPSWAPFCPHFQRALCSVWFRKGAREAYAESCEEAPSSPVPAAGRGFTA